MRRSPTVVVVLAVAALLVAVPTWAQVTTATIRGVVTDPDGAPAAGVKVTVLNVETGFSRDFQTGAGGNYNFPNLPVGTYLLTAEGERYLEYLVQNIQLNVADVREQNIQMELGEFSDAITVTSSSIVVETIGGEVAGLITGEQVRELPLNGRNIVQLTFLMPGVTALDNFNTKNKGLTSGSDISVSGGSTTSNQWSVDGANNNDVGSNRTVLVYPSLEAVEEFKIHRNSYGAEFGGAGGAQVNLVTRGGTNQLQGSVFAFFRRDAWNRGNYILRQANLEKEPLDRDDIGFTLGGAIKKDKVHFFVSTEINEEVRGVARSALVPTAAERAGDFSQSDPSCWPIPNDPATGMPFPGNVIPPDRINEAGSLYLGLYSLPNASLPGTCNNWVEAIPVPLDWDQINARADWSVTGNTRLMVRYTEDEWSNPGPTAGDANGLWGDDSFPVVDSSWTQPAESLVAQLNQVIGSTAINTVTYSESGNDIFIERVGDVALADAITAAIPPIFTPKTNGSPAHPTFWGAGGLQALWNAGPWNNFQDLKIFKDDFEKVFGNHVVKAGVLYGDNRKYEPLDTAAGEAMAFWGGAAGTAANPWGGGTGNVIADFLLADTTWGFSEKSASGISDQRWEDFELYVADSWKVSPTVTFDFGVRYSKFDWSTDAESDSLNFDPGSFNPALGNDPCNGLLYKPGESPCGDFGFAGGRPGPNDSLVNQDDNFAPRLGLAWDVFGTGKSVMRFGFGSFYQRERLSPSLGLVNNPPFIRSTGGIRTFDGSVLFQDFVSAGRPSNGIDINVVAPRTDQFNITWEQQIGNSSTIEVSYVGSRGNDLLRSHDVNAVGLGDIDGNGVPDRLDYIRCAGDDSGNPCRAQYRPFGAFGDGDIVFWRTDGESEYDSLQTQYTLRFGRGSQLQASYTYANFDTNTGMNDSSAGFNADATVIDPYNPGGDVGPASTHRDHIFNASAIWNLPTFEGQGGFKEWVLGNWSFGGIVMYSTGTPITVLSDNPGGDLGGRHPGGIGYDGNTRPLLTGASCSGGSTLQILNPAAFTLVGYELGNVGQQSGRGQCEGPDFFQVDLSFYKGIPLGNRLNAQLRFEIFNIFNRTNVIGQSVERGFNPGVTLDAERGSATTIVDEGEPAGNFGQASAVRDPRQVQLGVKVSW